MKLKSPRLQRIEAAIASALIAYLSCTYVLLPAHAALAAHPDVVEHLSVGDGVLIVLWHVIFVLAVCGATLLGGGVTGKLVRAGTRIFEVTGTSCPSISY